MGEEPSSPCTTALYPHYNPSTPSINITSIISDAGNSRRWHQSPVGICIQNRRATRSCHFMDWTERCARDAGYESAVGECDK